MIWLIIGGAVLCWLGMTGAWLIQRATGNAGWVDVVWTFTTGIVGVLFAIVPVGLGPGPGWRQVLVAALAGLWSLRLGIYVAHRVAHSPEDVRYAAMRGEYGADFQRRFFWFMQIQASAAFLLGISVLLAARNPAPGLRGMDVAAVAVLLIAVAGEGIADRQMQRFKADPENRGHICDSGLWAWSRHPNYFFEWLGWCAYPLFAINLDGSYTGGLLALSGPALMYYFLNYASGIPPLERAMLARRGDAYRLYQARVSAFFLAPPKRRRKTA